MATSTVLTNKPINPRGDDNRPVDSYNRASLYSGKALDFDGVNDYVDLDGFTMTGNVATIVFRAKFSNDQYLLDIDTQRFVIRNTAADGFGVFNSTAWISYGGTLRDEVGFYAVVSNGTTQRAYFNGHQLGGDETITALDWDSVTKVKIASNNTGTNNFFDGQIAGFKIFNTALTSTQVADLYNNPEKVVPTGVSNTALKLWLPMMEGAGTTAYDGSPSGFVEDIVTGFTNGTTYPLDSFASNDDDITTAIKTSGFGGCVSNGHYYTNGQKVKVKFTYQKNSGDDLRVLFSSLVTGAGTAKSDIQYVSASGEFEHTFTMTEDGVAYLQLGTGNASHSIDAVITDVYVSPYKSTNHGTINGATYVNGVGAPVAQSAVMDWNKGSNFFSISDWEVSNATTNASISSSTQGAPNGIDTAAVFDDGTGSTYKRGYKVSNTAMAIGQITASTFVKKKDVDYINVVLGTDGGTYKFFALVDLVNGTINDTSGSLTATSIQSVGDGWYYVSVEAPHLSTTQGITYIYGQDPTNGSSVDESYTGANNQTYIWGINIQEGAINNIHLPTIGALQSSPVLLPQGLTSGRDITGVNLFENVRKQGALNLDGNSWAEVHDNASLDFGTGSFTLEAWVKVKYTSGGSVYNAFLTLGGDIVASNNCGLAVDSALKPYLIYNTNASVGPIQNEGDWIHIVGNYDGTKTTLYVNGSQVDQDTISAGTITNTNAKMIGKGASSNRIYSDQIAQPRIYNRALTASEVLNNYNATKAQYQ